MCVREICPFCSLLGEREHKALLGHLEYWAECRSSWAGRVTHVLPQRNKWHPDDGGVAEHSLTKLLCRNLGCLREVL